MSNQIPMNPAQGIQPLAPRSARERSAGFRLRWILLAVVLGVLIGGGAMGLLTRHADSRQTAATASEGAPRGQRRVALYRNPMDPKETSAVPRKDPMGMDYLPVYEDELTGNAPDVDGLATVTIDPARQQLIGVRRVKVTQGAVGGTWRTVGRVEVDQTRIRKTNVKVDGYVERVFVDYVGKAVRKGQPLFSLYSPALLVAQKELLLALETRQSLESTEAGRAADLHVDATRARLRLWDVPPDEIQRLERTREPTKTLVFVSPISGVVTVKNVVEGAHLNEGDMPYEITDLHQVWIMADVYESDLSRVRPGMAATLTVSAYPNRTFEGRVDFIEPLMDPKTRTARVRIRVDNPVEELKPEMFGEVVLEGDTHQGLQIPLDAVVRAGQRDVVFVALGNGKFQPREVVLGPKQSGVVEVQSGLQAGEEVVTRANFLVDSESQLGASLRSLAP